MGTGSVFAAYMMLHPPASAAAPYSSCEVQQQASFRAGLATHAVQDKQRTFFPHFRESAPLSKCVYPLASV